MVEFCLSTSREDVRGPDGRTVSVITALAPLPHPRFSRFFAQIKQDLGFGVNVREAQQRIEVSAFGVSGAVFQRVEGIDQKAEAMTDAVHHFAKVLTAYDSRAVLEEQTGRRGSRLGYVGERLRIGFPFGLRRQDMDKLVHGELPIAQTGSRLPVAG